MNSHAQEQVVVLPSAAILEELAKVLSSALFRGSNRSSKLLRFLVEQTLNGQQSRLKEYAVGTAALGRARSFDPRTDPIVRTEASRLRSRLDNYYRTEGQDDLLVIVLPKGRYVPRFECRTISTPRCTPRRERNISIAVLPLANLSTEAASDYFSDGMTDEIAAALAKVRNLRVVARSSAYAFKHQSTPAPAIGMALGASHLIDGSVRQEGNRVRITAQLIDAPSGLQLWAETYDRNLTDLFAIQEDIATSIASALLLQLGLGQGDRLVPRRTTDWETYQSYLRGRAFIRGRRPTDAIAVLEDASRDREYAPALAMLSQAHRVALDYDTVTRGGPADAARGCVELSLKKAEVAAREAMRLDPDHAGGYAALAYVQTTRGNWVEADDLFQEARGLDASDPETLFRYAQHLMFVGRISDSLHAFRELRSLEPFVPIYNVINASVLQIAGQNQEALDLLESSPADTPARFYRGAYLAWGYAQVGRYAEAADALAAVRDEPQVSREALETAAHLLRAAKKDPAESLPSFPCELSFVYAYIGAPDRIMEFPERELLVGARLTGWHWSPMFAAARKTERFKTFVHRTGLVDYWRAKGWADLCRPVGADDFVCD